MVAQCKEYVGQLHVYGNDKVMRVIHTINNMVLAKKQLKKVDERVIYHVLEDGASYEVGDMQLMEQHSPALEMSPIMRQIDNI